MNVSRHFMKVNLATSRAIGEKCIKWAEKNLPEDVELSSLEESDIFISILYEKLISEAFIASKKKCFNFHPGILPQYRGAGAFSWAILNGDHSFGVTLHEIDVSIDHGSVIAIETAPILDTDTAQSLFQKGEAMIFKLFKQYFVYLLQGNYEPHPQNEANARIYYRRDLERAKDITRIARAFYFTGKEQAFYLNKKGEKVYLNYADN